MSRIEPPEPLRRRFDLGHTAVTVAGQHYELLKPKCIDDLISEEDFDIDERIPYWAECWPSAQVLADRVAGRDGHQRRMLELGCGIGLISLAAARAGFEVLATDYYAEALEFTSANAERHGLADVDTRLVDWRRLPDDLGTFDLVVGSDVLYERPHAALIAQALARTLTPDGLGLISDPGRRTADSFVEICASAGLTARCTEQVVFHGTDAKVPPTISIFEIRRAG